MNAKLGNVLYRVIPPLVFALVVFVVWETAVRVFDIAPFLLPAPSLIVSECSQKPGEILKATASTAFAASVGLTLSLLVAVGLACLFAQSRIVRNSLNPYAICLQTTPIISIAPLIIVWLGEGYPAVIAIAFIISFFPILTNTTTGLLSVPRGLQDVFRLYHASRWKVLWKLQLPNSMPYLVAGLKTSGGLAVLGSIVGDFFAGYSNTQSGLGYLVYQYKDRNVPLMFGCIAAATLLGLTFYAAISLFGERLLLHWCDRKVND